MNPVDSINARYQNGNGNSYRRVWIDDEDRVLSTLAELVAVLDEVQEDLGTLWVTAWEVEKVRRINRQLRHVRDDLDRRVRSRRKRGMRHRIEDARKRERLTRLIEIADLWPELRRSLEADA